MGHPNPGAPFWRSIVRMRSSPVKKKTSPSQHRFAILANGFRRGVHAGDAQCEIAEGKNKPAQGRFQMDLIPRANLRRKFVAFGESGIPRPLHFEGPDPGVSFAHHRFQVLNFSGGRRFFVKKASSAYLHWVPKSVHAVVRGQRRLAGSFRRAGDDPRGSLRIGGRNRPSARGARERTRKRTTPPLPGRGGS